MKPTNPTNNTTIQDDWEEVNDDDFSVVSVATSDNHLSDSRESLVPVEAPTYVSVSSVDQHEQQKHDKDSGSPAGPPTGPVVHHSVTASPGNSQRHVPDEAPEEEFHDSVESLGMDTRDVRECPEQLPSQLLRIPPDPDVGANALDPSSLNKANATLMILVKETTKLADEDRAGTIKSECQTLEKHLQTLAPILKTYAKHWELKRGDFDPPLDPGLRDWMSNLQTELLALQDEFIDPVNRNRPGARDFEIAREVSSHEESLAALRTQIEVSFPVIETDYVSFCFDTDLAPEGSRGQSPDPAPEESVSPRQGAQSANTVGYLRRELCELKDQVSACVDELGAYQRRRTAAGDAGEDLSVVAGIATAYRSIKFSLDTTLTNHFSEWTAGGGARDPGAQGGGLTYAELCRLDPESIRSLYLGLKNIVDELVQDRNRVLSLRYMNDPDNLLDQEDAPLLGDARVEKLFAMEERIASTLAGG